MTRRPTLILVTAAAVLAAAPAARADLTVNPREVPAGSVARFDIRVSNDRAETDTVQITVRLPVALRSVSFQPKPGWERGLATVKLAQPFTNADGVTITERVDRVTWKGKIAPGEFEEFSVTAKVPPKAGTVLAFPALQRYSDGEVVRWIGSPNAEKPAAEVTVGEAQDEVVSGEPAASAPVVDENDSAARANLALLVAILALIIGVAALVVTLVRRWRAA